MYKYKLTLIENIINELYIDHKKKKENLPQRKMKHPSYKTIILTSPTPTLSYKKKINKLNKNP